MVGPNFIRPSNQALTRVFTFPSFAKWYPRMYVAPMAECTVRVEITAQGNRFCITKLLLREVSRAPVKTSTWTSHLCSRSLDHITQIDHVLPYTACCLHAPPLRSAPPGFFLVCNRSCRRSIGAPIPLQVSTQPATVEPLSHAPRPYFSGLVHRILISTEYNVSASIPLHLCSNLWSFLTRPATRSPVATIFRDSAPGFAETRSPFVYLFFCGVLGERCRGRVQRESGTRCSACVGRFGIMCVDVDMASPPSSIEGAASEGARKWESTVERGIHALYVKGEVPAHS